MKFGSRSITSPILSLKLCVVVKYFSNKFLENCTLPMPVTLVVLERVGENKYSRDSEKTIETITSKLLLLNLVVR